MGFFSGLYSKAKGWIMSLLPVQDIFKQMGVKAPILRIHAHAHRGMAQRIPRPSQSGSSPDDDKSLGFPSVVCWDIARRQSGSWKYQHRFPLPRGRRTSSIPSPARSSSTTSSRSSAHR